MRADDETCRRVDEHIAQAFDEQLRPQAFEGAYAAQMFAFLDAEPTGLLQPGGVVSPAGWKVQICPGFGQPFALAAERAAVTVLRQSGERCKVLAVARLRSSSSCTAG